MQVLTLPSRRSTLPFTPRPGVVVLGVRVDTAAVLSGGT